MSGIERWRGLARPSRLLAAGLVTLGAAGIALAADAAGEMPDGQSAAMPAQAERQVAAAASRTLSLAGLPKDGAIVWGKPIQ